MPDAYRYEFRCRTTGDDYRLEFYPASDDVLVSYPAGDIEPLQEDAISNLEDFGWDVGDFPMGLAVGNRPKVTFKAQNLPATLVTWIRSTHTSDITLYDSVVVPSVTRGMVAILWLKISGLWYVRNCYIMDVGQRVRPDLKTGAMSVEFVDAFQAATKALTWSAMKEADTEWSRDNHVTKRGCIEYVWKDSSDPELDFFRIVGHVAPANAEEGQEASRYWFVTRDGLYAQWASYISAMMAAYLRMPSVTTNADDQLPEMRGEIRKQKYDTSTVPGDVLSRSSIYRLFAVTSKAASDASVVYTMHDAFEYKCFWDWFADYGDECHKMIAVIYDGQVPNSVNIYYHAIMADGETTATDYTDISRDHDPDLRGLVLQNAESSTDIVVEDDFDSHSIQNQGGRNDKTDTIVVTSRSCPVVCDYLRATEQNSRHKQAFGLEFSALPIDDDPRAYGLVAYQYSPRFEGFYYLDRPGDGYFAFDHQEMIRAHAWIRPNPIDPVPTLSDLSFPPAPFPYKDGKAYTVTAYVRAEQQKWGTLIQLADATMDEFGNPNGSLLKFTAPLDMLAWRPFHHPVTLDLTQITRIDSTWLDGAPTRWVVRKVTANLMTGLMEVEAYGR